MAPTTTSSTAAANLSSHDDQQRAMPAPPAVMSSLECEHVHSHDLAGHSLPDCISQGGTIAEWQPNTYNHNSHVRVHMPDGSDKFFPNVKRDHLQMYLSAKADAAERLYDSPTSLSRDASPSPDEDELSDDEMPDTGCHQLPTNQPLFLNFNADLAPQSLPKKRSKERKQHTYRVNGVNILNRNSLDMQTAMERLKRRRENHNNVERKRRNNINNTIYEISLLMPAAYRPGSKPNKGNILRRAVDYIKDLQSENDAIRSELNTLKGVDPASTESPDDQSAPSAQVAPSAADDFTAEDVSAAATSCVTPTVGQIAVEPNASSPVILPPPTGLLGLEPPRLKVDPLPATSLSHPGSPAIISGRSSPENVVLPPISSELAKEFSLTPQQPCHAASFHSPMSPTGSSSLASAKFASGVTRSTSCQQQGSLGQYFIR